METEPVWLVYDGECPLCQFGVRHLRIREAAGRLELLDARTNEQHPVMLEIKKRGLNLDDGMVAVLGDQYYHGADALHVLACMGTGSSFINRMNARLFQSKRLCGLAYPFLKLGRRVALWQKSAPLIDNLKL